MQGIEKVFVTLQTRIMSDNIEKANFGGELLKHREEFETRNGYDKVWRYCAIRNGTNSELAICNGLDESPDNFILNI